MQIIRRMMWRLRNLREGYHELNRRAGVESEMWECINDKRPMPNKADLRGWALRLGVPEEFRK